MEQRYPEGKEAVLAIADGLPWPDLARQIAGWAQDPDPRAVTVLRELLTHRARGTYEKHLVPRLAARALLTRGTAGVEVIAEMVPKAPGAIYPSVLMTALWDASQGRLESLPGWGAPPGDLGGLIAEVDDELRTAADIAVRRLLVESLADDDLMFTVVQVLGALRMREDEARHLLRALTESSIRLTKSLIEEFEGLIDRDTREEDYQVFLSQHPVFLDPLAAEVIPKQRLGIDHITDYAVRRHDGRWLLVEIEKPQDQIVTGGNDFSAAFVHAFGQVVDFQRWVEDNASYAQRQMPGIASPRGLLVIGRRSALSDDGRAKLRRFNANSATIEVVTFEDLVNNARTLYRSIHRE